MKNTILFKRIITLIISISLIFGSTATATVTGTPELASGDGNVVCAVNSETDYFPVGDTRGFSVLSKREIVRDCNVTYVEQGECIRWDEVHEDFSMTPGKYNAYESNNYADALGSLLAALGAYDQIEHLWSGWKGYCEIGTKSDFSWAEDPMFWASMAMSMIMQGTAEGTTTVSTVDGVTTTTTEGAGFLADTAIGDTFNQGMETMGQAMSETFQSAGTELAHEGALSAANEVAITAGESATDALWTTAYDTATQQIYNNLGRCMVAGGFEASAALYEFSQEDGSGYDCDPVDEVCSEFEAGTDESQVMTMDEVQFNDLAEEFANQDPPENIYDYVYVIPPSPENGIVSFRMKKLNEIDGVAGMDNSAMQELQEQMKEMKLQISLGMTALSMAGCLGGMGASVGTPSNDSDRATLRQGLGAAINFAAAYMGPYGALIAAALKIILYVATSYKSIDSCHDEDDAKECGPRHERTQKSLRFDLCHLSNIECAETSVLAGSFLEEDCVLDGYEYCCYDQIMAKILVEQLKAQLGRDWAHCTGITLRDLNFVSFKQCTDAQITDSECIDGAHQVGDYDPTKAFQYKYHCIDMTEFLEYLKATTGMEIDMSDFEDFWNDMTEQNVNQGY